MFGNYITKKVENLKKSLKNTFTKTEESPMGYAEAFSESKKIYGQIVKDMIPFGIGAGLATMLSHPKESWNFIYADGGVPLNEFGDKIVQAITQNPNANLPEGGSLALAGGIIGYGIASIRQKYYKAKAKRLNEEIADDEIKKLKDALAVAINDVKFTEDENTALRTERDSYKAALDARDNSGGVSKSPILSWAKELGLDVIGDFSETAKAYGDSKKGKYTQTNEQIIAGIKRAASGGPNVKDADFIELHEDVKRLSEGDVSGEKVIYLGSGEQTEVTKALGMPVVETSKTIPYKSLAELRRAYLVGNSNGMQISAAEYNKYKAMLALAENPISETGTKAPINEGRKYNSLTELRHAYLVGNQNGVLISLDEYNREKDLFAGEKDSDLALTSELVGKKQIQSNAPKVQYDLEKTTWGTKKSEISDGLKNLGFMGL